MKKMKKYLLSDNSIVNVLLSLTMKEKPEKYQLSLTRFTMTTNFAPDQ